MRCKNCGWENSDENLKCEKCGSSLGGMIDTVSVKYQSTEGFDVKKTLAGCPNCGYPLRPSDQKCPNCNNPIIVPTVGKESNISTPIGGTIIASVETSDERKEGKKLVGFLVSYSLNPLGDFFPVFEGRNYIGRDNSSNICIQGDSLISSKHFSILYRSIDKKFKWKDEHSSNGTFINEKLLDEGELKNFDTIRIGSTKLLFIAIPAY